MGGKELGLREETLRQLMAPVVAPTLDFRDAVLKVETRFVLGFADPEHGIGFGYVCNRMDQYQIDPRNDALRRAVYRSIGVPDPYPEGVRE